jgi:hypothetical protein
MPEGVMLIFWKQRLVILSVPKTGTTAIEAALADVASAAFLRPPEMKHTPAYRYQRFLKPYLQNTAHGAPFTAVALMREPVDWLASWYRFRQRADLDGTPRSTTALSFAQFAAAYRADPRPEVADVGGQARFLSGMDGAPLGVDRLFRYEDMPAFLDWLQDRLALRVALPRVNVSPPGDVDLPGADLAALRDHLAPEYALYRTLA